MNFEQMSRDLLPKGLSDEERVLGMSCHVSDMDDYIHARFMLDNVDKDIITLVGSYSFINYSLIEAANIIVDHLHSLDGVAPNSYYLWGSSDGNILVRSKAGVDFPLNIKLSRYYCRADQKSRSDINITMAAPPDRADQLTKYLDDKFSAKKADIHWWYVSKRGAESITMTLDDDRSVMHNEFYPWFEKSPKEYFQDFINSSASILLLSGPPGTGKTTYLRKMMLEFNMVTYIGYDINLFKSDVMFIEFISNNKANLMVMEDAESLVLPRGKGEDSIVSRFLNVSDGLIKHSAKKFIFTTNDSDFSNIDSALIRPGRCFGSVDFRLLTFDEANTVAQVAGLPLPLKKREYTLAELFNQSTPTITLHKLGF